MKNDNKNKQLLKILIGAAWIDGIVQPEERVYLRQVAAEKELSEDPEIKPLLFELKPVNPSECYQWLENYLGENPNLEDYQNLLEAIGALIYSDGQVDTREAQLLNQLENLGKDRESKHSIFDKILKKIQKLYKKAIQEQV
jgi:uncharacterized membrane protein YebE (DUF533 family)